MDKKLMDSANSFVKDVMKATSKELSNVQDSPIGTEKRSKKEFGIIMKSMMKLSPEERQIRMIELANISGHQGNELDGCDLCNYIKDSMLGK